MIQNESVFYITPKGEKAFDFNYEFGGDFHEELAWVLKENRFGYINTKGQLIIPIIYKEAGDFHENMAKVGFYQNEFE